MGNHPPVVVIGAGIGGLSLTLLRQQGVQAEVLDRAGQLREVGAAIAVAANGTRVLQRLGLAAGWPGPVWSPPGSSTATAGTGRRSR